MTKNANDSSKSASPTLRSHYWLNHFRKNLERSPSIDWDRKAALTLSDDARVIRSIQSWQLGETSDGAHLLQATRDFLDHYSQSDDESKSYLETVQLFIREEQKHGENLGRYLDKVGADRIKFDLGDSAFRLVRSLFTNMEIWSASVLMVETMAQIYYKALRDSGRCELLSEICTDILIDEAFHLKFQCERIGTYYGKRSIPARFATKTLYQFLYTGIISAVWIGHHHAFQQGGLSFKDFWRASWRKFLGHWRQVEGPPVHASDFQRNEG